MRERARLVCVEGDCAVTKEDHPEFWFHYQRAVLLALKEEGVLNEAQYRYGEEKLKQRRYTPDRRGGREP